MTPAQGLTNLTWPATPFGARQRPFTPRLAVAGSLTATIALEWGGFVPRPLWACVVYLRVSRARAVCLDEGQLTFGFELLTGDDPARLVARLDDIVVTARRQASVLAGHDLGTDLYRLTTSALPTPPRGIPALRQQWIDRAARTRGCARLFDTALDLAPGESTSTGWSNLLIADEPVPAHGTTRQAITRTLAIALLAARATSGYHWNTTPNLDQLVTANAWDQLPTERPDTPASAMRYC